MVFRLKANKIFFAMSQVSIIKYVFKIKIKTIFSTSQRQHEIKRFVLLQIIKRTKIAQKSRLCTVKEKTYCFFIYVNVDKCLFSPRQITVNKMHHTEKHKKCITDCQSGFIEIIYRQYRLLVKVSKTYIKKQSTQCYELHVDCTVHMYTVQYVCLPYKRLSVKEKQR